MLAKKYKIQTNKEYKRIYKYGKKINTAFFIVKFTSNNLGYSRFGLVVSRKVSTKATKRNKTKRQISNILRDQLKKFNRAYDIILITKKNIIEASYQEMEEDIIGLLKSIKCNISS